jgi:hypothetical protein
MPNIQELKDAFTRAYRAGDEESAKLIANALKRQIDSQNSAYDLPPDLQKPSKPAAEPESGMGAAFRSGLSNLEADRQAILSSFGVEGAEAKAAAARKRAGEQYKQPEFLDQPLNYIGGLAAQSAPYMVAPIVAGGIAASAPVSGALGIGAGVAGLLGAGAASAGQFTGSNLSRQLEGGTAAKDLDVTSAVVAAIPQAALDTVSLRMIPGLRGILGKAGVEITEEQAAKIARDGIIGTTANAVKAYGPAVLKTAGTEGLTESAQQVLERAQAGLSITDPQARQEYYDSFIGGAVLGGTFAVPGHALERGEARGKFEKEAQLKKEAEAKAEAEKETARRQTPEYLLDELDATFNQLQEQKAALLEQRTAITGGKKKLPKDATSEQREAFEDLSAQLKETEKLLYKIGPEYNKNKEAIAAAKQQRKIEEMSPQDRFLYGDEGPPVETAAPETERTLLDIPEDQTGAAPEAKIESIEGAQQRAGLMLDQLNAWRGENSWRFERDAENKDAQKELENEVQDKAVSTLMQNPALAQRMVDERIPVPGFSSKESNSILSKLKLQLKAAPEAQITSEQEALQRMGQRTRTEQKVESETEALQRMAENKQNPPEVTRLLNEIIGKLEEKQTKQAVPSNVPLGEGAVDRRDIAANEEGVQKLQDLLERYRVMSRQKGAARNDAEMADLLEEIRIAAQPRQENVIGEGEAAQQGKYTAELNRLAKEQNEAFQPAVEAIYELNEYRKTQKPGTIINPQRVAAEKAARDRYVNAVLQEIEANRRAASKPSVTEEEAKTIAGRINNILTEAGTRSFGAPAQAQAVLREQIDEIRREASIAGERKFQKAPEEFRLTQQYAAVEEKKLPTELGERRTAVAGRMEDILADEKIKLDDKSRSVLADATRMVRDGSGSEGLVEMLEEAARRYETGANIDRTERDLFSPAVSVPAGQKLVTSARPGELGTYATQMDAMVAEGRRAQDRTITTETQNADLVPAIEKELQLVRKAVSEDTGQGDLFTTEAGEGRVRELKRQRDALQKRIAGRKGKKITMQEFAQHRADIAEEKRLVDEIVTEEKAVRALKPEAERMRTATTRSTPERFIKYLNSAEVARLKTKTQIKEAVKEDTKNTVDVERSLGLIDAHIAQMQKRMDDLVAAVQAARKTAAKQGKRSAGYERVQKGLINRALNLARDASKIDDRYTAVNQFVAQQASSIDSFSKIIKELESQKRNLEKEFESTRQRGVVNKALNLAAEPANARLQQRLKVQLDKINADINAVSVSFVEQNKKLQSLINGLYTKIDRLKAIDVDSLVSQDAAYLKEYTDANKNVKETLAKATDFREVLTTIQEARAKFVSQIAEAKRVAEGIKRAPTAEREATGKSIKETQKVAAQQTGLGLPGTKVVRRDFTTAIEETKDALVEAEEKLEDLTEARKNAKGAAAGALTKQINKQNAIIAQLKTGVKSLESKKTKTAKPILTGEREIQKPLPQSKATKAGEKFKESFDEFKLAGPRAEGELPYQATKVTKRKITAAEHNKLLKAFEEGLSSERGGGGAAPANRLELIRQVSDRFNAKNKKLLSRGKVKDPLTKAGLLKELGEAFMSGTNIEKRVEVYDSVDAFIKDNPYYEGVIPADAKGFVNTDDVPYGDNDAFNRGIPRVVLFANNIGKGNALGVLLHELGVHVGFRNFFSEKEFNNLVKVVDSWAKRTDNSIEAQVGRAAVARVEAAKTPAADRADELLAYAVEEAINMGIDPTALKGGKPITNWLKRLMDAFKNALKVLGLKPQNITAQNFVDFAYGTANLELRGAWHGSDADFETFSRETAGQGEGAFDKYGFEEETLGAGPYVSRDLRTAENYKKAIPFGKAALTTGYGDKTYTDYRALDAMFANADFDELTEEQHRLRAESQLLTAYLSGVGAGGELKANNYYAVKHIENDLKKFKKRAEESKGKTKVAYERAYNAVKALSTDNLIPLKEEPKPGTLYRTIDDIPDDKVYYINSYIKPGVDPKLDALVKKYGNERDAKYSKGYPANALFYDIRKKLGGQGAADALQNAGFLAVERINGAGTHHERAYLGVTPEILAKNITPVGMPTEESSFGTQETARKILFSRDVKNGERTPTDIAAAVDKIVAGPQTIADRITSEATGIGARTMFIDRLAPMERVAEHLKKSAQAMQMLYYGRIHDQRMSLTAEAVNNGAPMLEKDDKGNYVIKSRGGANLAEISAQFGSVRGYGNAEAVRNLFTAWMAAKRAKNMGIGKAKLNFSENVTQEELDRIEALGDQIPQFERAREIYNKYNAGLIDWLKQAGAIDEKTYKLLTSMEDYIPYYRAKGDNVIMEIAGIQPFTIGNLRQQPYLKELVGGDEKIQDFFTSSLQNTSMLVDMGLRNLATKEIAFSLQSAGLLKGKENKYGEMRYMFPGPGPAQPNVIRFKRDGKDYFAIVESEAIGIPSELLVKGLHGTPTVLGGVTKIMAIPARFLRAMVTRSPVYMVRQLLRDSTSNYMLAGGNMMPVLGATKELAKMYAGMSAGEKTLQERGIIGGQILSGTSEDMQKIMLQLAKGGSGWEMALAKLDRMSMASDAASRISLYNSYRNQGLSDMEATLATLESMNFSKRGASGSLYAMNMMIPFLNAQIQGLDVLYKAFTGKLPYSEKLNVQRKLYTRGLMMAGMTVMYAAMMQDDEAYKNANMRDRLANWFIRIPGFDEPIKVPIPFEIGLIFKALPEAMLLMNDKDRDVKEVLKGLAQLTATSVPFGPSSVPQAVKPIIEASVNKSFFTGQDIESPTEQGLMPGERVRDKTSGVAKFLGETIGVSPVMVDHFINGYTGGLGLAIAQAAGTILPLKPGPEAPDKRLSEMPVIGSMFQPNDAPGQINLFYEKAKEYEQAKNTFDKMVAEGRKEDAVEFAKEYAKDITMSDVAESFKSTMNEFTEMEKLIKASDLSGAEKLQRLKEVRATKIEFARSFNAASRQ